MENLHFYWAHVSECFCTGIGVLLVGFDVRTGNLL